MNKAEEPRTAKRLLEAFLGKSVMVPAAFPKPDKVYELKDMIEDLIRIPDPVWGRYVFSRDPLRGKFSEERKDELAVQAAFCGRAAAEEIICQYGKQKASQLAKLLQLKVDYPIQPQGESHVTFAQYTGPDQISIFRHSLEKAEDLLKDTAINALMQSINIREVLLGHELYHYVEEKNAETIFSRTEKVDLWTIKPFKNRSTIRSLGEIAAMGFTQTLCDLPYSPFILDVFLIYGYTKEAASSLYQEIIDLARFMGYDNFKIS